jgi:hypothetical protein
LADALPGVKLWAIGRETAITTHAVGHPPWRQVFDVTPWERQPRRVLFIFVVSRNLWVSYHTPAAGCSSLLQPLVKDFSATIAARGCVYFGRSCVLSTAFRASPRVCRPAVVNVLTLWRSALSTVENALALSVKHKGNYSQMHLLIIKKSRHVIQTAKFTTPSDNTRNHHAQ